MAFVYLISINVIHPCPCLHDRAFADYRSGLNKAVIADHRAMLNYRCAGEYNALAYLHSRADYGFRFKNCSRAGLNGWA